jgi:phage shock protein C
MKNLKLLIAFLAGVAVTLLLTGKGIPNLPSPNLTWVIDEGAAGTLGVIALILVVAYLTRHFAAPTTADPAAKPSKPGEFFEFLRSLRKSQTDRWVGGVCGGLGKSTPIPSWVWRVGFAAAILFYGSGLLAYLLLWLFVPEEDVTGQENEATQPKRAEFFEFLHELKRSSTDCWVGGVCGGLAEKTAAPAWVWRLGFTGLVFFYGSGLLIYLLLWVFLPPGETKNHLTA